MRPKIDVTERVKKLEIWMASKQDASVNASQTLVSGPSLATLAWPLES